MLGKLSATQLLPQPAISYKNQTKDSKATGWVPFLGKSMLSHWSLGSGSVQKLVLVFVGPEQVRRQEVPTWPGEESSDKVLPGLPRHLLPLSPTGWHILVRSISAEKKHGSQTEFSISVCHVPASQR
jgi:hypothetical protein